MEENNGNLTLSDGNGHVMKRHVTQTKKISEWRKEKSPAAEDRNTHPMTERKPRERKAPAYLQDYVQLVTTD